MLEKKNMATLNIPESKIFPEVEARTDQDGSGFVFTISTYLRIKGDDGKYYLQGVRDNCWWNGSDYKKNKLIQDTIMRFYKQCFFAQTFSKPQPSLVPANSGLHPEALYPLDDDQMDEKERLLKKYFTP